VTSPAAIEEAWRQLDQTQLAPEPPSPELLLELERKRTGTWEPVTYFGVVLRHGPGAPLPANCQHSLVCRLEASLSDVTREAEVRTVTSPVSAGTQAVHAPDSLEGEIDMGMGGRAVLGGAP
jgi:hypothetical protein